jgi:hypothetical protein
VPDDDAPDIGLNFLAQVTAPSLSNITMIGFGLATPTMTESELVPPAAAVPVLKFISNAVN